MAGGLQSLPLTEEVKEEKSEESNFEKKRCRPIFIVGITLLQIGFFIYDHICITHFDVEKNADLARDGTPKPESGSVSAS